MKVYLMLMAVAMAVLATVNGDHCSEGSTEISGNWFCQPVSAIQYSNVGFPGAYQQVAGMPSDGICPSETTSFSGPLAPLDEEVSIHIRGPIALKQFAVYFPSTSTVARRQVSLGHARRHGHAHLHRKRAKPEEESHRVEKRTDIDMVTATIDGVIVSWINNYFGPSTPAIVASSSTAGASPSSVATPLEAQTDTIVVVETAAAYTTVITVWDTVIEYASPVLTTTTTTLNLDQATNSIGSMNMVTATIDGQVVSWTNNYFSPATSTTTTVAATFPALPETPATAVSPVLDSSGQVSALKDTSPQPTPSSGNHDTGVYTRIGYYDSASSHLDNLVFLGNYGGQGSGCVDEIYGASLAYANSAGTGGAEGPQILENCILPSDAEIAIMLGEECGEGDCGFVRPGSVAYHGFEGADKVFLFEFSMPHDSEAGFNGDMPAIWMLNAKIPRTLQYGSLNCSCWESGCGEFDIAEALFPGSTYLKSTVHTNTPGGDSDYIVRPTSDTMKLAVVFDSSKSTARIQVLDDNTDFSASLTLSQIEDFCTSTDEETSHFVIST